jgi:type I restriction enzyme, S subunit
MFYRDKLLSQRYGGAQPNISQMIIRNLSIPLPSQSEQQKIAYILTTIQQAIEKQERIIKTIQELKKALMHKLFTEGLNHEPQKQTEIGLIPQSWEVIDVSKIGEIITGTTPPTKNKDYYSDGIYPFISPADIGKVKYIMDSEKKVSQKGLNVSRILPKNSILCVCIGSTIGKVGLTFSDRSCSNQQINSIVCSSEYNPVFYYYNLLFYSSIWKTLATPSPVPILSKGKFTKAKVSYPKDMKEQKVIADILSTVDSKIEFQNLYKSHLEELFKTMLNQLMRGQIRVQNIDFEGEELSTAIGELK